MPKCPQCGKPLREFSRRCPSCQADLDLLVDYVSNLQGGLERAEAYTREGELGKAFWAYLQVLETDPDNTVARRQIGQVVTAVRQFDRVTPGRRWLSGADEPGGFQPGCSWAWPPSSSSWRSRSATSSATACPPAPITTRPVNQARRRPTTGWETNQSRKRKRRIIRAASVSDGSRTVRIGQLSDLSVRKIRRLRFRL